MGKTRKVLTDERRKERKGHKDNEKGLGRWNKICPVCYKPQERMPEHLRRKHVPIGEVKEDDVPRLSAEAETRARAAILNSVFKSKDLKKICWMSDSGEAYTALMKMLERRKFYITGNISAPSCTQEAAAECEEAQESEAGPSFSQAKPCGTYTRFPSSSDSPPSSDDENEKSKGSRPKRKRSSTPEVVDIRINYGNDTVKGEQQDWGLMKRIDLEAEILYNFLQNQDCFNLKSKESRAGLSACNKVARILHFIYKIHSPELDIRNLKYPEKIAEDLTFERIWSFIDAQRSCNVQSEALDATYKQIKSFLQWLRLYTPMKLKTKEKDLISHTLDQLNRWGGTLIASLKADERKKKMGRRFRGSDKLPKITDIIAQFENQKVKARLGELVEKIEAELELDTEDYQFLMRYLVSKLQVFYGHRPSVAENMLVKEWVGRKEVKDAETGERYFTFIVEENKNALTTGPQKVIVYPSDEKLFNIFFEYCRLKIKAIDGRPSESSNPFFLILGTRTKLTNAGQIREQFESMFDLPKILATEARHSWATAAYSSNLSETERQSVARLLGHNITTHIKYYTDIVPETFVTGARSMKKLATAAASRDAQEDGEGTESRLFDRNADQRASKGGASATPAMMKDTGYKKNRTTRNPGAQVAVELKEHLFSKYLKDVSRPLLMEPVYQDPRVQEELKKTKNEERARKKRKFYEIMCNEHERRRIEMILDSIDEYIPEKVKHLKDAKIRDTLKTKFEEARQQRGLEKRINFDARVMPTISRRTKEKQAASGGRQSKGLGTHSACTRRAREQAVESGDEVEELDEDEEEDDDVEDEEEEEEEEEEPVPESTWSLKQGSQRRRKDDSSDGEGDGPPTRRLIGTNPKSTVSKSASDNNRREEETHRQGKKQKTRASRVRERISRAVRSCTRAFSEMLFGRSPSPRDYEKSRSPTPELSAGLLEWVENLNSTRSTQSGMSYDRERESNGRRENSVSWREMLSSSIQYWDIGASTTSGTYRITQGHHRTRECPSFHQHTTARPRLVVGADDDNDETFGSYNLRPRLVLHLRPQPVLRLRPSQEPTPSVANKPHQPPVLHLRPSPDPIPSTANKPPILRLRPYMLDNNSAAYSPNHGPAERTQDLVGRPIAAAAAYCSELDKSTTSLDSGFRSFTS